MARKLTSLRAHDVSFFPPPDSVLGQRYRYVTVRPWPSLLFVAPLLVIFEVGTYLRAGQSPEASSELVATYLIDLFIKALGASGAYFPGLMLVAILLAIHLVARHPWRVDLSVLLAMWGESLLWTLPLFVFDRTLQIARTPASVARHNTWINDVIRSLGAGLYEELVFRLICITLLAILLVDVFKLPRIPSAVFGILLSSLLFAAHHCRPLGSEEYIAMRFAFRTLAGLYLACLFVFRGFGIAAGCHAFYNVIVVTIVATHT